MRRASRILLLLVCVFSTTGSVRADSVITDSGLDSDQLKHFIGDTSYTTNVFELSQKAGMKGAPAHQPWSGAYWPLHTGSIADPYNEGNGTWLHSKIRMIQSVDHAEKHFEERMSKIRAKIESLSPETIDEMAPSEKYDLYLGDHDFSLTNAVWKSLMEANHRFGSLPLWEGSCQGWSTGAIFAPRPKALIEVMSLDGKYIIPFYPDDLKALVTLLWANSLVQDHTVQQGIRCQDVHPKYDLANGHVNTMNCQGVNPGSFHTSVLELVGTRKQSFVINRVNNTQVWNQPIANYEVKYFNPATDEEDTLEKSVALRGSYEDPMSAYRNPKGIRIVGVNMRLKYTSEKAPSHSKKNSDNNDRIESLILKYDLELDENNLIIGGEWLSAVDPDAESAKIPAYPGFIWKFEQAKPTAFSVADYDLPSLAPSEMNREAVIAASIKASQFHYNHFKVDSAGNSVISYSEPKPQPLGKIVNSLISFSHGVD